MIPLLSVVELQDFRLEILTIQLPRLCKDTSHWQKYIISACYSLDWVQPKPRGLAVTVRHWCSFPIGHFPSDSPWCEQTAITSRIFPLCLSATNWSYEVLFNSHRSNLRLAPLNQPKVKPNTAVWSKTLWWNVRQRRLCSCRNSVPN